MLEAAANFHLHSVGHGGAATAGENEIDLVLLFVPPRIDLRWWEMGTEFVEHQMFPETSQVLMPHTPPASGIANEPGIEAKHLGHGRFPDFATSRACLYLSADHFAVEGESIYRLAEDFYHQGGRRQIENSTANPWRG